MTIWGLEGGFELRGGGGGEGGWVNGMMKMISVAGFVFCGGGNDGLQLSIANCPVCPFTHI